MLPVTKTEMQNGLERIGDMRGSAWMFRRTDPSDTRTYMLTEIAGTGRQVVTVIRGDDWGYTEYVEDLSAFSGDELDDRLHALGSEAITTESLVRVVKGIVPCQDPAYDQRSLIDATVTDIFSALNPNGGAS